MKIVQAKITPLTEINGAQILKLLERIARTCYQSWDKICEGSAEKLVAALDKSGHTSIFEHYSISMNYISNIAAYKDLTRHRHTAYAVESTRFCTYSNDKFGNEIKFLDPIEIPKNTPRYELWKQAMLDDERNYLAMAELGASADELSLLLPQSTAAEFNITANLREWNNIFDKRARGRARRCVKQIMQPTLELFHKKIPIIFDVVYNKMMQEKQK